MEDASRRTWQGAIDRAERGAPAGFESAQLALGSLEQAAGGDAVREAVLGEIGLAAAEVGIEPGSAGAAELSGRLREARIVE